MLKEFFGLSKPVETKVVEEKTIPVQPVKPKAKRTTKPVAQKAKIKKPAVKKTKVKHVIQESE